MIPRLWQNIITLLVLIFIVICIIYAIFRIQERLRVESEASRAAKSGRLRYSLVWEDNFTEETEILPPDQVIIENNGEITPISTVNDFFEDNFSKETHLSSKKDKKVRRRKLKIETSKQPKDIPSVFQNREEQGFLEREFLDQEFSSPTSPSTFSTSSTSITDEIGSLISYKTINYNIWNVLNLPGTIVGSSIGNNNEQSFYLNNPRNIHVANFRKVKIPTGNESSSTQVNSEDSSLLQLRVLNSIINVSSPNLSETFLFTTASAITRGSFLRGFFTFRIRINSSLNVGGFPFIRLQSYTNSSLNIIQNKYGDWPDSGEIDILEPIGYSVSESGKPQLEWTGKLWFSTQENPLLQNTDFTLSNNNENINGNNNGNNNGSIMYQTAVPDKPFKPLKLDKFYTIGIEWLNDRMIWYKNAGMSVTGVPSGKVIGQISAEQWWSVNSNGKLNPKPAPFDVTRSINVGVATPGTRYLNDGTTTPNYGTDSIFNIDFIKVYSARVSTTNISGEVVR